MSVYRNRLRFAAAEFGKAAKWGLLVVDTAISVAPHSPGMGRGLRHVPVLTNGAQA